jgi:hypothetical protein
LSIKRLHARERQAILPPAGALTALAEYDPIPDSADQRSLEDHAADDRQLFCPKAALQGTAAKRAEKNQTNSRIGAIPAI